jgi:hypothetical protein
MAVVLLRFTLAMLTIGFAQPELDQRASEPVARVGKRTITRLEINCELTSDDLQAIAEKQSRGRDELCLEREQLRLDHLVTQELYDAAIRKLAIDVSAKELAADAAFHHYGESEFERLSEHYRLLAHAALRIYRGEDAHVVYLRDVRGGWAAPEESEDQFRRFVTLLRSAGGAQRFLERQTPDQVRESITDDARRRIARDKLMQVLSAQAERENLSLSAYSDTFWGELSTQLGVEILDVRYKRVSLKGLSWQPKQKRAP